ncbi:hypothetical protein F1640_03335 [Novosphingobium sp. NBM11]|uniref:hypothetical protein n=1 Tax=Novosphingobium sp. NBM11 TaxID=2596914 RepID=UPI0018921363|nr:hypothetical protein [Novosphingobium sp. NBM11]MBF5089082.1 hypothetical protein [Novosphingobium sp. NBM11]
MTFPTPVPGLVIRYAFLWSDEARRGQEEGTKDRPCAVLLTSTTDAGETLVIALPVTHTPPTDPDIAVELPLATKRRLGLDDARSWIIVTEGNRFIWPGPDLRISRPDDPSSAAYGQLPSALYEQVREKWLNAYDRRKAAVTTRTT